MDGRAQARQHVPMKTFLRLVLALIIALAAYLLLWPVPVQPVAWQPPPAPGYAGAHASNQRLAALQQLPLGGDVGPEHVVVREEGGQVWVWMALAGADGHSGRIVRMKPDGSAREVVVDTGGRPLGFDFDASGALIVADPMHGAHGGLLRVTGRGAAAQVEVLADQVDGDPILFADAVIVARNGRIYLSDASRRFGAKAWGGTFEASVLDILEHQRTGRVLEYDPATRRTQVMISGLSFPNGLALSQDEQQLFVAETGEYRIWKIAVAARGLVAGSAAAQASGHASVLLANLPGYPDNLMRGQDGRIWTGLTKPRGKFIDDNAGRPWLRALALRLPKAMWPVPPAYGHVFAFDESGRVLDDLQDPSGAYPETTAVTETADRLYVQSLHARTLGYLPRRQAGP
jgi:sugar lactone lactonase YvrE